MSKRARATPPAASEAANQAPAAIRPAKPTNSTPSSSSSPAAAAKASLSRASKTETSSASSSTTTATSRQPIRGILKKSKQQTEKQRSLFDDSDSDSDSDHSTETSSSSSSDSDNGEPVVKKESPFLRYGYPLIPCPTFDGLGDYSAVESFICKGKIYLEQFDFDRRTDASKQVALLWNGIEGKVRSDLTALKRVTSFETVGKLFRTLRSLYGDPTPPAERLHNIRQRPDEPSRRFALRIRTLAIKCKLFGRRSSERALDRFCLAYLRCGLKPKVAMYLRTRAPRTFDKAISVLRDYDDYGGDDDNN